jgi:hypothetical protein
MPSNVRQPSVVRSFGFSAAVAAALFLAAGLALAQDGAPTTRPTEAPLVSELLTLHAAGFSAAELNALLDKNGEPTFTEEELARLEAAAFPADPLKRLRATAAKHAPKRITFDEIKTLLAAGVDEEQLLATIAATTGPIVDANQLLELVRAGASPAVIRALRTKSAESPAGPRETAAGSRAAPPPALDDLPRLVQRGFSPEAIRRRIVESDVKYDVDPVKLVELSRAGVPTDVLKAVWERRKSAPAAEAERPASSQVDPTATGPTGDATTAAALARDRVSVAPTAAPVPVADSRPAADFAPPALAFHDDPALGFALLVPEGFEIRRDARNGNTLTSFVRGEPTHEGGLAEAELALFTYRSAVPERLVESNLGPVLDNFLASLTASYAKRKISVSFGTREARRLAGRPALRVRLTTAGADGAAHAGELWCVFVGERTFVVSSAVRTDRAPALADALGKCIRSFAPIERKGRVAGSGDRTSRATHAANAWRDAVLNRDYAAYDALHASPSRDRERALRFVELCDRFDDPDKRFVLGPVDTYKDGAATEFKLIGGAQPVPHLVRWTQVGEDYVLQE